MSQPCLLELNDIIQDQDRTARAIQRSLVLKKQQQKKTPECSQAFGYFASPFSTTLVHPYSKFPTPGWRKRRLEEKEGTNLVKLLPADQESPVPWGKFDLCSQHTQFLLVRIHTTISQNETNLNLSNQEQEEEEQEQQQHPQPLLGLQHLYTPSRVPRIPNVICRNTSLYLAKSRPCQSLRQIIAAVDSLNSPISHTWD